MTHRIDRRGFLKTSGAAGAGLVMGALWASEARAAAKARSSTPDAEKLGWKVSCAQYTFRRFTLYETLDRLVELGICRVEPAFFLRLDKARPKLQVNQSLSAAERKELKTRLADHGIAMASFYSNLAGNEAADRKIFDFAKEMSVEVIVAEPPPAALGAIDKLCGEYEISLGIHNHPKKPGYRNWDPANVMAECKGHSKRIGACCDTGHWVRSGLDVVECLKKMEGRITSMHLKDVIEAGNPAARDVPLGTGKANYAAVLAELKRQGFQGIAAIEYEHDSPELMKDVAQCVAFVEKTSKKLAG